MNVAAEPQRNAEAIEAWNTVLFDKFQKFRRVLTDGLSQHGDAALAHHRPPDGARVLDIGCGFGDTTLELARRAGPRGLAVGVDAAPRFIDEARQVAASARVANARFQVADVQSEDLGGPYDYAFSRFGTMFFASPLAAFRNVRRALVPGAPLVMVVWRRRETFELLNEVEQCVRSMVSAPLETTEPTCGPGPFSLSSADVVTDLLRAAGFDLIALERCDTAIYVGSTVDETIEFAMELGPAGELLRLAGDAARDARSAVRSALRDIIAPHARPDGVWTPSSSWIVSARA
jgi:ubiquinone/menaquinone biosynthesis C-methylase UbiE